ncbi:MAG TPA: hypothetical protein VGG39_08845 [Polyangiaceae bacterium]
MIKSINSMSFAELSARSLALLRDPATSKRLGLASIAKKIGPRERAVLMGVSADEMPPPSPAERKLAGEYRVIHGRILLPSVTPDGGPAPTLQFAEIGDVLFLDDLSAAIAVDAGVVERADADPSESRVGKVWDPPKPAPIGPGMLFKHDRERQDRARAAANADRAAAAEKEQRERDARDEQIREGQRRLARRNGGAR